MSNISTIHLIKREHFERLFSTLSNNNAFVSRWKSIHSSRCMHTYGTYFQTTFQYWVLLVRWKKRDAGFIGNFSCLLPKNSRGVLTFQGSLNGLFEKREREQIQLASIMIGISTISSRVFSIKISGKPVNPIDPLTDFLAALIVFIIPSETFWLGVGFEKVRPLMWWPSFSKCHGNVKTFSRFILLRRFNTNSGLAWMHTDTKADLNMSSYRRCFSRKSTPMVFL